MGKNTCVICGEEFEGYGNNAAPYAEGICCDECNALYVIPARIELMQKGKGATAEPIEAESVNEDLEEEPAEAPAEVSNNNEALDLNNIFNSLVSDKFSQITELKSLCEEEPIKNKPEIVEILKSIIDDLSIHVGQYQEIISYLDGNYQSKVDAGKNKAQEVLASHEAPVEETGGEPKEEKEPKKEKDIQESRRILFNEDYRKPARKPATSSFASKAPAMKLEDLDKPRAISNSNFYTENIDGKEQAYEIVEDDFEDEDLVDALMDSQSSRYRG